MTRAYAQAEGACTHRYCAGVTAWQHISVGAQSRAHSEPVEHRGARTGVSDCSMSQCHSAAVVSHTVAKILRECQQDHGAHNTSEGPQACVCVCVWVWVCV